MKTLNIFILILSIAAPAGNGAEMKEKITKAKFPIICISYAILYWQLLGLKLSTQSQLYTEVIIPIKHFFSIAPTDKISLTRIELMRDRMIDSIDASFAVVLFLGLFLMFTNGFSKTQRVAGTSGFLLLALMYFIIPRIT